MSRCVFCKSTAGPFTTREHVLPESLGGGDWAILPEGLLCDKCQNIFGSSIEQQALVDYPFSNLRVFLGIPTKKRKPPWLRSWEGVIRSSLRPGVIYYEPAQAFEKAVEQGRKTQIRLVAHPLRPDMVCRFLIKMGIEVVAADDQRAVFDEKFDEAREFALSGKKSGNWWYVQYEDNAAANRCIIRGVPLQEWVENVKLEVVIIEDGAEVFHLKLLYLDMIIPLESRIQAPPMLELSEPEYRLFVV